METAPHRVRINFVSPGATDTEMAREMAKDHGALLRLANGRLESFRPRIPAGTVAKPEDVAAAVAFLLSPEAGHIHLHDLLVDGGELLGM
jgi:2,3-dihydro-2,3-dihydroxybenzoate dehydrogenase